MIELPFINGQIGTFLLVILLILAFVVAFKIMKMVLQTVIVAFLSAVFYVALVFLLDFSFAVNNILLFSFLGAAFYMLYSTLASAYKIGYTAISIPYRILKGALLPFKIGFNKLKERRRMQKIQNQLKKDQDKKDPKDVVLDKLGKKKD